MDKKWSRREKYREENNTVNPKIGVFQSIYPFGDAIFSLFLFLLFVFCALYRVPYFFQTVSRGVCLPELLSVCEVNPFELLPSH